MNECGCSEGRGWGWTGWCSGHLAILVVLEGLERARGRLVPGVNQRCDFAHPLPTHRPCKKSCPIFRCLGSRCCQHLYLFFSTHLLLTVGSSDSLLPCWLVPLLCQLPLDWWFWAQMLVLLLALLPSFSPQIPTYLHMPNYGPAVPQSEPSSSF